MQTTYDTVRKVWSGSKGPCPMFDDSVTLGCATLLTLKNNPNRICQINADDESVRTNGEVYCDTFKFIYNLRKSGCSKGDVVGFICENSHTFTSALLASLYLAAPPNVLDLTLSKAEIVHIFRISTPKFVFCDDAVVPVVKEALQELSSNAMLMVLDNLGFTDISDQEIRNLEQSPPLVDRGICGALICGSGTASPTKCIALSHAALLRAFNQEDNFNWLELQNGVICFPSMYWTTAWIAMFTCIFSGVPRIITTQSFTPKVMLSIVKKYNVAIVLLSPNNMVELFESPLLEEDSLRNLKRMYFSGSILTEDYLQKILRYVDKEVLKTVYGMTETGIVSISTSKFLETCLNVDVDVKILDDRGYQVGVGKPGEICVKTPTQFTCYFNKPEATRSVLDPDGWFYTGDIGYFTDENLLRIVSRKKDIFKYDNHSVIPSEIEEFLEKHPGVLQAVVAGVPDQVHGALPAALVIRKANSTVTVGELLKFAEENLPDFKRLYGGVFFVNELPLTPSGKIKRKECKEMIINLYNGRN
ncbi:hypothetical protein DMENIID0001_144070 [Sergentomyia squamirostris]